MLPSSGANFRTEKKETFGWIQTLIERSKVVDPIGRQCSFLDEAKSEQENTNTKLLVCCVCQEDPAHTHSWFHWKERVKPRRQHSAY